MLWSIIKYIPHKQLCIFLSSCAKRIEVTHYNRSSCSEVFCKKGVLEKFAKFTEKHLCQRLATLLKKRLWHTCFLVNFEKFIKTPFLLNTSGGCFYCNKKDVSKHDSRLIKLSINRFHTTFLFLYPLKT